MHTNKHVETVNSINEHFPCVSNSLSIPMTFLQQRIYLTSYRSEQCHKLHVSNVCKLFSFQYSHHNVLNAKRHCSLFVPSEMKFTLIIHYRDLSSKLDYRYMYINPHHIPMFRVSIMHIAVFNLLSLDMHTNSPFCSMKM